jgi:hypothetical protein
MPSEIMRPQFNSGRFSGLFDDDPGRSMEPLRRLARDGILRSPSEAMVQNVLRAEFFFNAGELRFIEFYRSSVQNTATPHCPWLHNPRPGVTT